MSSENHSNSSEHVKSASYVEPSPSKDTSTESVGNLNPSSSVHSIPPLVSGESPISSKTTIPLRKSVRQSLKANLSNNPRMEIVKKETTKISEQSSETGVPEAEGTEVEDITEGILASSISSTLSRKNIDQILSQYFIPNNLPVKAPSDDDRANNPPKGFITLYEHQLQAGLRIPLSSLLSSVLEHYKINLSQLTPNSIRTIIGFELLCAHHKIVYNLSLFRRFFSLKTVPSELGWFYFNRRPNTIQLLEKFPTSIHNWKRKFFFLNSEFLKKNHPWRIVNSITDKQPQKSYNVNGEKTLESLRVTLDVSRLPERILVQGKLSSALLDSKYKGSKDRLGVELMNIAQLLKAGRAAKNASSSGKTSPGNSTTVAAPAEEVVPPVKNLISTDEPKAVSSGLPPLPEHKEKEKKRRNYKRKTPASVTETTPPSKRIDTAPPSREADVIPTSAVDITEPIPSTPLTEETSQNILPITITSIPTTSSSSIPFNFSQDSAFGFLSRINPSQVPISYSPVMHPGDFFCPGWGFNRNSRILTPALAQQWLNESILPRDQDSLKQLSNEELLNIFYLHSAQGAALSNRAAEIIHDASDLRSLLNNEQKKIAELEEENKRLTELHSRFEGDLEMEKTITASLRSSLETEQKKSEDLRSKLEVELDAEKNSSADLRSSLETEQKNSEVLRSQVGQVTSSLEVEKEKTKDLQFTIQRLISNAEKEQRKHDDTRSENERLCSTILTFERHSKAKQAQYNRLKEQHDHLKETGSKRMIENFLKSKEFAELVSRINLPVVQIGYNEAVEAIQRDHLPDKSLKELGFDDDAEDRVNAAFKEITGAELNFSVRQFVPPTPVHENPEVNLPEPENKEVNEQP